VLPDVQKIRTADNVQLGYTVAGIPSRLLAFMVDMLLNLAILVVAGFAASAIYGAIGSSGGVAEALALTIFSLMFLVGHFLYFAILEATSAGRTPGKRAMGLRVVRVDGSAPGLSEALIRNIARIADYFLALGLFVAFFNERSRRIGDLLAGTMVVRERTTVSQAPVLAPVLVRTPDAGPGIDGLDRLGQHEYTVIRTFLSRYGLPPDQRTRLAWQIAQRLLDRMGLPSDAPERMWPPELFLERLYLQLGARLGAR
jgi:uncharacterized RDD family membrane protein YckC